MSGASYSFRLATMWTKFAKLLSRSIRHLPATVHLRSRQIQAPPCDKPRRTVPFPPFFGIYPSECHEAWSTSKREYARQGNILSEGNGSYASRMIEGHPGMPGLYEQPSDGYLPWNIMKNLMVAFVCCQTSVQRSLATVSDGFTIGFEDQADTLNAPTSAVTMKSSASMTYKLTEGRQVLRGLLPCAPLAEGGDGGSGSFAHIPGNGSWMRGDVLARVQWSKDITKLAEKSSQEVWGKSRPIIQNGLGMWGFDAPGKGSEI
ncbi:hypothetical protein BU15DRAFT_62420 [Melanogaster broomeanus]|nr:hypothetical protein BU15DRAFT_62420 [Melanogaster broomeanus]